MSLIVDDSVVLSTNGDSNHLMQAGSAETFQQLTTMEQLSVLTSEDTNRVNFEDEKSKSEFRNYVDSDFHARVSNHYMMMRKNQTVEFVKRMHKKWLSFDHANMTIAEAFTCLEGYVDSSDPDADFPNLEHCIQTAEGIRAAGHPEWFQLVGLIHDMGKVMFLWGNAADGQQGTVDGPQWALGGDTWVVGANIPESAVMPELNSLNPDMSHSIYSSKFGMYKESCGIENLMFAYGHDEYMYRFCLFNKIEIPKEGLAMIRFHSCYPWHTGGAYKHFERDGDAELKKAVLCFNKYDLYTKSDERPNVKLLWPYYQGLIDKFCPAS